MKFRIRTIFIGAFFLLYSCGFAGANQGGIKTAAEVKYSQSPFAPLVKRAFRDEVHYCSSLDIGDEALLARIHLIKIARQSIYIQTYIWEDDETGRFMLYELIRAAGRGVEVKIIVDQFARSQNPGLLAFLSTVSPNFEIRFYNPNFKDGHSRIVHFVRGVLRFKQFNQRMHNKVFIIDGDIAVVGGRNYQNDYFDRGDTRNFKDRDALVIGPVVDAVTDSFMDYWTYELSIPGYEIANIKKEIEKGSFKKFKAIEDYRFGGLFDALGKNAANPEYIKTALTDRMFKVKKVEMIADYPGKNKKRGLRGGGLAVKKLVEFLSQARESIIMQTPYLVLDKKAKRFFKKLKRDNPNMEILVSSNSLAAADHFYAYAFSYKYKKVYVKKLKWRIFEFKRRPEDLPRMVPLISGVERTKDYFTCIHSKTFIVDDSKVYIGSFNVDPRSAHLNTETGVIIHSEEFTQIVKEEILRDINPRNSWTIGKRGHVPFIAHFSQIMDDIMKIIPVIDAWPFGYTASFKLREGKEEVPFYHKDFYKNYKSVGPFPDAVLSEKEMKARLTKVFFGPLEPLI